MNVRSALLLLCTLLAGGAIGFWLAPGTPEHAGGGEVSQAADGPCPGGAQPAYWVAPMDASYRRDAPGKSPMGMDLVPHCEGEDQAQNQITVSAATIHNLGVRTAPVVREALRPDRLLVGELVVDPARETRVHSRAEGWVQSLGVSGDGDVVAPGDVLYRLFSPTFYSAEADYLAAAGNDGLQRAAAQRLRALGYRDAQIKAVQRRGKASDTVQIQASSAATVTALPVRAGQYVQPGTHLMTLAELDSLWMLAELEEAHLADVPIGAPATVTVSAYPGLEWTATLERRSSTVDSATRTLALRLVVGNEDGRLQPGMFARARVALPKTQPVLSVPASSVIRDGRVDRVVKALGDGRFAVVGVVLGQRVGDRWEIREGLRADDRVVVQGQFMLDTEANVDAEALRMEALPGDQDRQPGHEGHDAHDHGAGHGGHSGHSETSGDAAQHDMDSDAMPEHPGQEGNGHDHGAHAEAPSEAAQDSEAAQ